MLQFGELPFQYPISPFLLIKTKLFDTELCRQRKESGKDTGVDNIIELVNVLGLLLYISIPFNKGTFVLSAASAIDREGSVTVPEETVKPLLSVMTEENVLAPVSVWVPVNKTTFELNLASAIVPVKAAAGIVPAAMFAPLIVGALVPKLMVDDPFIVKLFPTTKFPLKLASPFLKINCPPLISTNPLK
jgi:hypothetical protein